MAQVSHILARLKRDPIGDLPIADQMNQLLEKHKVVWRERLLPPLVTLRLFLIQILSGNTAIAALRQLSGIDFARSSYSDSRKKLSLPLLQSLLLWMNELAEKSLDVTPKIGPRILIGDGSSHSMEDTPALRKHFDLPPGAKPGVGYPMQKLMGLLDAATGMFVALLGLPLFQHDMRAIVELHPMLRAGDILLGDRAFCSFAHVALLQARGVFACFRLHQRRKTATVSGVDRWKKPTKAPAWMSAEQFAQLPAFVDVRIVRYSVNRKGFRTDSVIVATTLRDEALWPDEKIAELYGHRWLIETCYNHLKTTMNMNVLRCKDVEGVQRELAVYLAAYNLVRLTMLRAAEGQHVSPHRISFIDAMRWLLVRLLGLPGVGRLIVNPEPKGRSQLRMIRRRVKQYELLREPRRETEAKKAEKAAKNG
jgi:hypothetical protein